MGLGSWARAAALLVVLWPATGPVLAEAAEARRMVTVYLTLLKKGPAWTPEQTPATKALQEAHLANIRQLWQAQKMIVAGPTEDAAGELRGIFVIKAGSLDEAKALAASDPAVKAGRLVAMVYPWWVEEGVLPDAGSYCTAKAEK